MPISPAVSLPPLTADVKRVPRGLGLSPQVIGLFLALSLVGIVTTNPLLTVASIAVLPFLIALTWSPGEPPVLSFVLVFHWLQATTRVFHANIVGADVQDSSLVFYSQFGAFADVETAIWLTLIGLVVLAIGMRAAIQTMGPADEEAVLREAETFSVRRAFWLYLFATFALTALVGSVGYWSGFRTILIGVGQLKWALYFFLGYLVLVRREGYVYFLVAFAIEFISGIGFFAGFKEVIFVSGITYFAARSRIGVGTTVKGLVAVFVLIIIGTAWTVVKPEYRETISGGSGQQGAVVDQGEQVAILVNLLSEIDGEALAEGLDPFAGRIAYVDFFGYVLNYVPTIVPHEDGALWGAALKHVATPRVLFPSKPAIISDSEVTNRYTGLGVAGEGEGTSFSIGYMAESYVDFGAFWMFVPILLVGVWRGLMYRFFLSHGQSRIAGYAFTVALFINLYQLEKATGKLLGGLLMRFIVLAILFHFAVPVILRWLRAGGSVGDEEEIALPVRRAWA